MNIKTDKLAVAKMSYDELVQSIEALRKELFQTRLSVMTSESANTAQIRFVRKQIARRIQQLSSLSQAELKVNA
jgi:ribosomal protein L29